MCMPWWEMIESEHNECIHIHYIHIAMVNDLTAYFAAQSKEEVRVHQEMRIVAIMLQSCSKKADMGGKLIIGR